MSDQLALEVEAEAPRAGSAPHAVTPTKTDLKEILGDETKQAILAEYSEKEEAGEISESTALPPKKKVGMHHHPDLESAGEDNVPETVDGEAPDSEQVTAKPSDMEKALSELERVKAERDEALLKQRRNEEANRLYAAVKRDPETIGASLLRSVRSTKAQQAPPAEEPTEDHWLLGNSSESPAPADTQTPAEARLAALEAQMSNMAQQAQQERLEAERRAELNTLKATYNNVDSGAVLKHYNEYDFPSVTAAYKDLAFDNVLQARDIAASAKVKATKKVSRKGNARSSAARKSGFKPPPGLNRPDAKGDPVRQAAIEAMEANMAYHGKRMDWKGAKISLGEKK